MLGDVQGHSCGAEVAAGRFRQLLSGLVFLHENDVVHQDIKPENLLLTLSGSIKICDFGETTGSQGVASFDAEKSYCPMQSGGSIDLRPGAQMFEPAGSHADIWAAGLTAVVMLVGGEQAEVFKKNLNGLVEWQKKQEDLTKDEKVHLSKSIQKLLDGVLTNVNGKRARKTWMGILSKCFHPDYKERESAPQILETVDKQLKSGAFKEKKSFFSK